MANYINKNVSSERHICSKQDNYYTIILSAYAFLAKKTENKCEYKLANIL